MLSPARKWIVFALVFLGIIISYIDRGNLGIAAASIMHDLSLEPARMGLLLSAFFWTYALFQLPAGYLVDRFGIRTVYAIAFPVWSLASASIALSHSPGDIIASRMLLGFAESVGPIASLAFIRRYFDAEKRGLPTALYIGGQTLGPALGTLAGSLILARYGWRVLFAGTGLGALIWVPFWIALAPNKPDSKTVEGPSQTAALAPLFTNPLVWALSGAVFFSSYFWWFVMTWMPAYLTSSRGFSTTSMGQILSVPLFAMVVTNLIAGWAADKLSATSRNRIGSRALFGIVGLAAAASLLLLNLPQIPILPVLVLAICGFGVASATLWTIAQSMVSSLVVARYIGYLNTLSQIAGVLAPLVTGYTLGPHNNFHFAISIAGVAPLLAAACLFAFRAAR